MILAGEMLIMLIMLNPCSQKSVSYAGMLIMLIMLNQIGDSWENPKMDLTLLTLLTFPLWEAKMLLAGEMLIMLIMLNPCSAKRGSYAGNVNDV